MINLTRPQEHLLALIEGIIAADREVRVKELAERLGVKHATICKRLHYLEKKGYIRRVNTVQVLKSMEV